MTTILGENKEGHMPPGWKLTQIGNLAEIHGGSTPSTSDSGYWENGNILWATPTDITSLGNKFISDTYRKISEKAVDETALRLCEPGTLLMTSRATIGYPAIAEKPITTNQGFINIHCGHKLEVLFFYYWIIRNRTLLERYSQGSTFLELPKKDFRRFHIPLPPLPEQCRIAEIISTVDEAIEKTDAVIQETQQLKKGLMQKLFTEGIGHTQFKETKIGRIPEEWEVLNLSALFQVIDGDRGINYPKSDELLSSGYCAFLNAKNVTKSGFRFDEVQYITQQKDKAMGKGKLTKGDFVLTTRGTLGNFAYFDDTVVFDNRRINSGMVILRPLNNISARFYYMYFNSYCMQKQIERIAYGTAQSQLTVGGILKFAILVPPPNEQNQIAKILSEVDIKIETEQAYKAELEQLKKGLMQVLLTGKVRVKV